MLKKLIKIGLLALVMIGQAVQTEAKIKPTLLWESADFPGARKMLLSHDDSLVFSFLDHLIIYRLMDGKAIDTLENYKTGDFTDDGEYLAAIQDLPEDSTFYVDILRTKTLEREKRFQFSYKSILKTKGSDDWIIKFNARGNEVAISKGIQIVILNIETGDTTLLPYHQYLYEVGEFGNDDRYLYYDKNRFFDYAPKGIYGVLVRRDLQTGTEEVIEEGDKFNDRPFSKFIRSSDRRYIAFYKSTVVRDIIDSTRIETGLWPLSFSRDIKYILCGYGPWDLLISFMSPKTGEIYDTIFTKYTNFGFLTSDNQYLFAVSITDGLALYHLEYESSVEDEAENALDKITNETLYPNPTDNTITLKFTINEPMELSYSLYSINGELINEFGKAMEYPGEIQKTFKLGNLSAGMYLLQVQGDNYKKVFKVINK